MFNINQKNSLIRSQNLPCLVDCRHNLGAGEQPHKHQSLVLEHFSTRRNMDEDP